MKRCQEQVYTVTDYYDGPRGGIADFQGQPHAFEWAWDAAEDDWSCSLLLKPIDPETLRLALEDQAIWLRWEQAFHSGQTDLKTHPALPEDRARSDELEALLKPRLAIDPEHALRARGRFEVKASGMGVATEWVVSWSSA